MTLKTIKIVAPYSYFRSIILDEYKDFITYQTPTEYSQVIEIFNLELNLERCLSLLESLINNVENDGCYKFEVDNKKVCYFVTNKRKYNPFVTLFPSNNSIDLKYRESVELIKSIYEK